MFESRVPSQRAWERWTPELTRTAVDVDGAGLVESWHELLHVSGSLVTFRTIVRFDRDDLEIESRSTLRFRDRAELEASLADTGYTIIDVRDAPDRPGLEYVIVANRQ